MFLKYVGVFISFNTCHTYFNLTGEFQSMYSEFTDTEIPMSKTEIVSFFVVYLRNYKFISIKTNKTFNDSKIINIY